MRALPIRGGRYQIGIEDAPTILAQLLAASAVLEHAVRLWSTLCAPDLAVSILACPGPKAQRRDAEAHGSH